MNLMIFKPPPKFIELIKLSKQSLPTILHRPVRYKTNK